MEAWDDLLEEQYGVVSRPQALAHGMTDEAIKSRIRGNRWQRLYSGVYATFSGDPLRQARLWAALLKAGAGATLSHETAAELEGLQDRPGDMIHVTVPHRRRVGPIDGVRLHRSGRVTRARHPARLPPRTRVEETVLDLVTTSRGLDQALSWVAVACQRRLTTTRRLANALSLRPVMRWRAELRSTLGDVAAGAHSLLELRYVRNVERPHGLPAGARQYTVRRGRRKQYQDVRYDEYRTVVELDGRPGHEEDGRWRDMERDNASIVAGDAALRYGLADTTERPCALAVQVGGVLQARGWEGAPHPCGRSCDLREDHGPYSTHDLP